MLLFFGASAGLLLWVFVGYPTLLRAIVRLRGPRPVLQGAIEPSVSLVISAYNEAAVIRDKIENALALDYPRDRLEVAVISDASSDGTDEIALGYADRGVTLFRQEQRRGKTAGLNRAVPRLRGDIVVFSDANAMYEPDAVRKLVRNFADPGVGCVTGEARYRPAGHGTADAGESAYWNYELQIKRLETAVGSSVGGDGAIYAIRRALWTTLPETAINDFLNPLQIVAAGWRSIYEPEAVCWEATAGGTLREYRRRVRIVSRSWRAVFQAPQVLNPFRVGFFALSVVSHKVLRWFAGLLAGFLGISLVAFLARASDAARWGLLAAAGVLLLSSLLWEPGRRLFGLVGYFAVLNVASTVGLVKGTFGFVSGTWAPPRAAPGLGASPTRSTLLAMLVFGLVVASWVVFAVRRPHATAVVAFWVPMGLLVYVYVGYPLIMWTWRRIAARPTSSGSIQPRVCLLVAAHNEESVLGEKLRNALTLDYPRDRLDVLVVSDGSSDRTVDIARTFESDGVRVVEFPERRGKIGALNRAMAHVAADIVVFSDANTFLEPPALRRLVARLADPQVGAVSGDVILVGHRAALGAPEDLYYAYERWLQAAESDVGSMVGADGALYAIRRELFVAPPDDTILDDMAIPIAIVRAGRRVVFEPGAQAFEQGSRSAWEEFARKSRVVAGSVQLIERAAALVPWHNGQFMFAMVSHKVLRWLSPVLALTAFVAAAGLAQHATTYVAVVILQGIVVLAGLAGCSERLRNFLPVGTAHYFLLVQSAALAGLVRGMLGLQPVAWQRFARTPADDASRLARPGSTARPS